MAEPRFDPGGFYEFNLSQGTVRTRGGGRVLLLSDGALSALVSAAASAGDLTSVRRLGKHVGEYAIESFGADPTGGSPEVVLGHVAAVLGVFGWGQLGLERWGDALVATVKDGPVLDERQLGMASLLGGLFTSVGGREVACVPVENAKFLLVDPGIADQVWAWAQDGDPLSTIVARLEPGEPS